MTDFFDEKNKYQKKIFVSYSWDSDDHKNRVFQFVSQLRSKGYNVILDKDMMYGDRMTHFMEKAVAESDIVLFICTPEYKQRADGRKGGVGYESAIITGELYETQYERKFIPVLFSGSWEESMPIWAKGKLGIDLRNSGNKEYENLLHTINSFKGDNTTSSYPQTAFVKKNVKLPIIILIMVVVIALIILAFKHILQINDSMAVRIEEMEKRLEYEVDRIYQIETSLYNAQEMAYNIELSSFDVSDSSRLVPTSQFTDEIVDKFISVDIPFNSSMLLDTTELIAYDAETNQEFTAQELANQRLLFTYNREEKEIFFIGQISEMGQLDGNCVVNVYEENKLVLITDAEYDNGILLKYKQAFPSTTSGQNVWAVTNQIPNEGINSGETWFYFYGNDYNQAFESSNVIPENILTVDEFQLGIKTSLEGYYCGNTSNGYFNDNTGNAYMIKFSEDGTVRMLYVGNFEDGQFNDDTGNAWFIAKSYDDGYFYYKGRFSNGMRIDKGSMEAFISQEQIERIVGEMYFNCELKWSDFEAM